MPWVPGGGSPGLLVVALWPQHEAHIYSPHLENPISVLPVSCVFWVISEVGCLHIECGAGSTTLEFSHQPTAQNFGVSEAAPRASALTVSMPNSTRRPFSDAAQPSGAREAATGFPEPLQLRSLRQLISAQPVAPSFHVAVNFVQVKTFPRIGGVNLAGCVFYKRPCPAKAPLSLMYSLSGPLTPMPGTAASGCGLPGAGLRLLVSECRSLGSHATASLQVSLVGPEWGQLPPRRLLSSTGLEEGPPSLRMRKKVSCPFKFFPGKASRLQKQRFNLNIHSQSTALSRGLIKGFNGLKGLVACGRGGRRPTGSAWGAQQLGAEAQPCEWENWCPRGAATGNQRTSKTQGCRGLGCGQGSEGSKAAKSLRAGQTPCWGSWVVAAAPVPTAPMVWGKGKLLEL